MTSVITVANLKGGTTKSTTVAFLAHALAEAGQRVSVIDADPQGSVLRWGSLADWDIPVLGMPTSALHRRIWGVIDRDRVDVVVVDTPPLEDQEGIVAASLRAATRVIVPMVPTMMDLDRVGPVFKAVEAATGYREDDLPASVLLNRTTPRATSTSAVREQLTAQGHHVLTTTVPRREAYAQAFGAPITAGDPPYTALAAEIMQEWQ